MTYHYIVKLLKWTFFISNYLQEGVWSNKPHIRKWEECGLELKLAHQAHGKTICYRAQLVLPGSVCSYFIYRKLKYLLKFIQCSFQHMLPRSPIILFQTSATQTNFSFLLGGTDRYFRGEESKTDKRLLDSILLEILEPLWLLFNLKKLRRKA